MILKCWRGHLNPLEIHGLTAKKPIQSHIYFLSPKTKGKLKIGQASIEVDGEIYKTSPIEISCNI